MPWYAGFSHGLPVHAPKSACPSNAQNQLVYLCVCHRGLSRPDGTSWHVSCYGCRAFLESLGAVESFLAVSLLNAHVRCLERSY